MMVPKVSRRLGAQLWLERDDDADRVGMLVARAAECGIRQLRIFLMWPWIEPNPGEWQFNPFDAAFDAAAQHSISIKATLTANSGPWWLGTPSVLHSGTLTLSSKHRPAMRAYVDRCVERYAGHPALGQWILWNEPNNPVALPRVAPLRTDESRTRWVRLLEDRYARDIGALNTRWRTGYKRFDDVPFPEDVTHPAHRGSSWQSFRPILDEWHLRVDVLHEELSWLADAVRLIDARTPLCVNPNLTYLNHAWVGYDLARLASVVDVLGASFHAPWNFDFAERDTHIPLLVTGVSLLANTPGEHAVELTEVQIGNTYYAGTTPLGVSAAQIAASYLAPILGGAVSVTGWCLNTRQRDFEAGEWGLLDDLDEIGDRGRAVQRVGSVLDDLDAAIGTWAPTPAQALVVTSEESQAVELVLASAIQRSDSARAVSEAIQGSALIAVELLRLGVPAALAPASALDADPGAEVIVISHMAAWSTRFAARLIELANAGHTLVIDGTSGQFDLDAGLHRPWPGGLTDELGARSRGLQTQSDGSGTYPVSFYGAPAGEMPLVRADLAVTADAWQPDLDLCFGGDDGPVLWERPVGDGKIILVAGVLAAAAVRGGADSAPLIRYILTRATKDLSRRVRAFGPKTITLTVHGERADAVGVFAPAAVDRQGGIVRLAMPPGQYRELWSGSQFDVDIDGQLGLPAPDGIALLVGRHLAAPSTQEHAEIRGRTKRPVKSTR